MVPLVLWLLLIGLLILAAGSLLNLSHSSHWFVRSWDFPRVQIIVLTILCVALYNGFRLGFPREPGSPWGDWRDFAVGGLAIAILAWHGFRVIAFTPLGRRQVEATRRADDANAIRLVISNVEMENQQRSHWQEVIRQADPDVLIAVEIDASWLEAVAPLRKEFPYEVAYPQDNWYGILVLSKLPLSEVQTRFLVQEDVPSVHAIAELPSGQKIRICGLHPRPPEPVRDNPSRHRDAELVLLAEELADEPLPVIVGGDLNDVAWSATTRLFLRLSGFLDPRRGRGFYNTFHANHWWLRFPLDHLFHSRGFTVRNLRRLPHVGSDHFPIVMELQYEPSEQSEQPPLEAEEADETLATELVEHEEEEGDKSLEHDQRSPRRGLTTLRPSQPHPFSTAGSLFRNPAQILHIILVALCRRKPSVLPSARQTHFETKEISYENERDAPVQLRMQSPLLVCHARLRCRC